MAPSLGLSEGTASAQRILRTVPVQRVACDRTGCNYPEGDCSGACLRAAICRREGCAYPGARCVAPGTRECLGMLA